MSVQRDRSITNRSHSTKCQRRDFISCLLNSIQLENKNLDSFMFNTQENSCLIYSHSHSHSIKIVALLDLKSDGNLYGFKTHSCIHVLTVPLKISFYCVSYTEIHSIQMAFSLWNVSVASKSNETIGFFLCCCFCFSFYYFNQDFQNGLLFAIIQHITLKRL